VLDFGLAQVGAERVLALADTANLDDTLRRAAEAVRSRGGRVAGTPLYMAPEQWLAEECTAAIDVWALGLILCELLGAGHPYADLPLVGMGARACADQGLSVPDAGLPPSSPICSVDASRGNRRTGPPPPTSRPGCARRSIRPRASPPTSARFAACCPTPRPRHRASSVEGTRSSPSWSGSASSP
jgi:serine/threonine protein kinase